MQKLRTKKQFAIKKTFWFYFGNQIKFFSLFLCFFIACEEKSFSLKHKLKTKKLKTKKLKTKHKKHKVYIEKIGKLLKVIFVKKKKKSPIIYRWKKNGNSVGENAPLYKILDNTDGNYVCEIRIGKKKWTSNVIKYKREKNIKRFLRPLFSQNNPFFLKPFFLHMATELSQARVLYVVNGKFKTFSFFTYQKPILIDKNTVVHSRIVSKHRMGPIVTRTYVRGKPFANYHHVSMYMPLKTEEAFKLRSKQIRNIKAIVFPYGAHNDNIRVNLHGTGSVRAKRKSFEIKLNKKSNIAPGFRSKSFFILGLSEDAKYYKMHLSFQLLKKIGLFFSFHHYTELFINDQSRGVTLLVEKVQNSMKRIDKKICGVVRRKDGMRFSFKYKKKNFARAIEKAYGSFENTIKNYKGKKLWEQLSKTLNLKMYMKWLAFNTWIQNGDYTGELFLGAKLVAKKRIYFQYISGWDYDSIFEKTHWGNSIVYPDGTTSLVYGEAKLDVAIAYDPYLYKQFKIILKRLLKEEVTEKLIDTCLDNTKKQLLSYLSRIEVYQYENSFDKKAQNVNLKFIKDLLEKRRKEMKERRIYLLDILKKE